MTLRKYLQAIGIIALALVCFGFGALSQKHHLLEPFRLLRNAALGDPLDQFLTVTVIKPRNTIFEAFHPQADVVMIGDSHTQTAEWREAFPDINIVNRGIGGDRSDDILRRIPTILESHPNKAFLMFGFNDFSILQTVNAVFANYQQIVDQLQENGVEVYIQSTLECRRITETCGVILGQTRELNGRLDSYAKQKGLIFININRNLTNEKEGLLAQYTYDGTHLLGSGYLQWRNTIAPYIEQTSHGGGAQ